MTYQLTLLDDDCTQYNSNRNHATEIMQRSTQIEINETRWILQPIDINDSNVLLIHKQIHYVCQHVNNSEYISFDFVYIYIYIFT